MGGALELGAQSNQHLIDSLTQVERAAARTGLIDGHLLEVADQIGGAGGVALKQIDRLATPVQKGVNFGAAQGARFDGRGKFMQMLAQAAGDHPCVAQRGVEFVGDPGDQATERSIGRKINEARYAIALEKTMTKDEILSLYLNRIYFGSGLYGIDAASRYYFGKAPDQITIAEAALLAALPKAPSKLNLRENLAGAKDRQSYVLREMRAERFITREEEPAIGRGFEKR